MKAPSAHTLFQLYSCHLLVCLGFPGIRILLLWELAKALLEGSGSSTEARPKWPKHQYTKGKDKVGDSFTHQVSAPCEVLYPVPGVLDERHVVGREVYRRKWRLCMGLGSLGCALGDPGHLAWLWRAVSGPRADHEQAEEPLRSLNCPKQGWIISEGWGAGAALGPLN